MVEAEQSIAEAVSYLYNKDTKGICYESNSIIVMNTKELDSIVLEY